MYVYYIQMGKNMAQRFMFIYALIIFLSQFFVVINTSDIPNNSNRNSPKEDVFCNSNDDCPTILYYVSKCVYNFCEYW
ncbi:putative Late nodulin [Medicago truncatula]|uniref:Late nodulin n=1 Tax=Medicago truncatula TaxID=3880 RepID=A7KH90_MEDTR|nr:nodule-specific cysteine-rich peptide 111 [Medicago truncatula]AES88307.1 late nodulin [Medicago truncatula]RHN60495.1 putative Late nodulin [Medicago truncatula]